MFCQLGNTKFDGLKSFVSFSDDEEAIIVEHALINRKARLQGAAIGLRNLNITIFLHQEYCNVSEEIVKLRTSKNNFEILPLLWGNGHLEGDFVIVSLSRTNTQMDDQGNTVAAAVAITLKESVVDDKLDQQQQQARDNAFATGDKKPPTKSNRVNKESCNKQISGMMGVIKNNADRVDAYARQYVSESAVNNKMASHCTIISNNAGQLVNAWADPASCVYHITNMSIEANLVKDKAEAVKADVLFNNNVGFVLGFTPNIPQVKADNDALQLYVKKLAATLSNATKSAIVKR